MGSIKQVGSQQCLHDGTGTDSPGLTVENRPVVLRGLVLSNAAVFTDRAW